MSRRQTLGFMPESAAGAMTTLSPRTRRASLSNMAKSEEKKKDRSTNVGEYYARYEEAPASPPPAAAAPAARRSISQAMRPRATSFGDNITNENLNRSARKPRVIQQVQGQEELQATGRASVYNAFPVDRRDFSGPGMLKGVRRLIAFLASREYSREVSEQSLMSPTVATFRDVFVSMASLVDPHLAADVADKARTRGGGWEAAVCTFFKLTKYPMQLSPKQLNAVGSANAWPKFLGALLWMVDLIEAGERVEDALYQFDTERRSRFEFLQQAYASYMQGDDAAFDRVLAKLREEVDVQAKDVRKRVEDVKARVGKNEAELTALLSGDDGQIPAMQDKCEFLRADNAKYQGIIAQWEKKREATAGKLARTLEEEARLEQELKEAREARAKARQALESQSISADDLARITADRQRLARLTEEVAKERQAGNARRWQLQGEHEQALEAVTRRVQDFNARAPRAMVELQVEPEWRAHNAGTGALVGEALMGSAIRPALAHARDVCLMRAHKAREKSLELSDLHTRNQEECGEIEARISMHRQAVKRMDERHAQDTDLMAAELEQLSQELRMMRDALPSQSGLGLALKEDEQEVSVLRYELESEAARFVRETAEADEGVHAALALMIEFKEEVEGLVEASGGRLASTKARVEQTCKAHKAALAERVDALR